MGGLASDEASEGAFAAAPRFVSLTTLSGKSSIDGSFGKEGGIAPSSEGDVVWDNIEVFIVDNGYRQGKSNAGLSPVRQLIFFRDYGARDSKNEGQG
jgi:hypothetical protein